MFSFCLKFTLKLVLKDTGRTYNKIFKLFHGFIKGANVNNTENRLNNTLSATQKKKQLLVYIRKELDYFLTLAFNLFGFCLSVLFSFTFLIFIHEFFQS